NDDASTITTPPSRNESHHIVIHFMTAGRHSTSCSRQFDSAGDLKFEVDAADRDDCLRRQAWAIRQLSPGGGIAHRLLDLPLGGHAERLEKFTYAGVESFLVHGPFFPGYARDTRLIGAEHLWNGSHKDAFLSRLETARTHQN